MKKDKEGEDARTARRLAQKRKWWHRHKNKINTRRRRMYREESEKARREIKRAGKVEDTPDVVPGDRG